MPVNRGDIAVVTGGAGFIGSHMVDLHLEEGLEVRVIDNLTGGQERNLRHHPGNRRLTVEHRDIRTLQRHGRLFAGATFVFHFAGVGDIMPSTERPLDYMDINVQRTVRVLECGGIFNVGAGDPQPVNRLVELLGGSAVQAPRRAGLHLGRHREDQTRAELGAKRTVPRGRRAYGRGDRELARCAALGPGQHS